MSLEMGGADLDTNWSHAWAATTVGDAEGLVEVQVAHVRADVARRCQSHLHTCHPNARERNNSHLPWTEL